ncbi:MAG: hypothetical protein A2277_00565 [Desulfobacterales bacterium RIFOXYA12_FULL_46_15]|nr:MAG: hypothetical protein A2277_00565 [Desulfobacterales bacterium RIFOXYA12_FULL_46_15]
MKITPDYDILTIVGSWNPAIITHDWVSKYIISDEKLNIEYPIKDFFASHRISTEDFRLYVSPGRFNFSIINHSDPVYIKIGGIALKLADYLIHTPVASFGLNFIYESDISEKIDSYFLVGDDTKMTELNLKADLLEIKRGFSQDKCMLNFNVIRAEKYKFDFNYHFNISSLLDFKEKFEKNSLIEYKKKSIELLSNLYDLGS